MHLVDLAGSERVKKTRSEGMTLKEASYINKSLTFLEQVRINGERPQADVRKIVLLICFSLMYGNDNFECMWLWMWHSIHLHRIVCCSALPSLVGIMCVFSFPKRTIEWLAFVSSLESHDYQDRFAYSRASKRSSSHWLSGIGSISRHRLSSHSAFLRERKTTMHIVAKHSGISTRPYRTSRNVEFTACLHLVIVLRLLPCIQHLA